MKNAAGRLEREGGRGNTCFHVEEVHETVGFVRARDERRLILTVGILNAMKNAAERLEHERGRENCSFPVEEVHETEGFVGARDERRLILTVGILNRNNTLPEKNDILMSFLFFLLLSRKHNRCRDYNTGNRNAFAKRHAGEKIKDPEKPD
ncbi:hypothetical protein L0Y46_03530 [bacterium]|nr:hypothetical protein [bacterium]